MRKINLVITAFFILITSLSRAQSHNEEVTVEGTYTPQIQKSERLIQVPSTPKRNFDIPSYEINTEDFTYEYEADLEPISPLTYTSGKSIAFNNNFVKAGFGTRLSPDFIFRHYSNVSKRTSLGIGIDHNSTWLDMKDYVNSKYMNNEFRLSMTNRFSQFQLHSHVDYHYDMYYIKDNPESRKIHSLNAKVAANNNKSSYKSLYDEFSLDYNYSGIQGGMQENLLKFRAHLEHSNSWFRYGNSTQTLIADIDAELSNIGQTLFIVAFNPHLDLSGDFYNLHLGLRVDAKTNNPNVGGIYPDIKGSLYIFQRNIEFYAGLYGSTKINTLKNILTENPFVISDLNNIGEFDYEKNKFEFQGGVKFKALSTLSGNIGIHYRKIDNHLFYISSPEEVGAFDIILNDCDIFNFITDLQFKLKDDLKLALNFSYNKYNILNESGNIKYQEAWYKPEIELTFKGMYKINKSWDVNMSAFVESYRYALTKDETVEKLKPICDMQLGCDYHFNSSLAFYAEIKNLIHNKYQMYYNYPSYGFQAFIGFKYRFL